MKKKRSEMLTKEEYYEVGYKYYSGVHSIIDYKRLVGNSIQLVRLSN